MLRCRNIFSINSIRRLTQDHYDVLRLKKDASHQEIRDAFVKLSKQFHPDGNQGNSSEFNKVVAAYKVLSKKDTRENYDFSQRTAPEFYTEKHLNFRFNRPLNHDEYYGLKGVKKVKNSKIVWLCAIFAVIGVVFQVYLVRGSLNNRQKLIEEKTRQAAGNHAVARANASKYTNEMQIERLKDQVLDKRT